MKGNNHEEKKLFARTQKDIDSLDVGELREGVARVANQRRHRQDGGDAEGDTGGDGVPVNPERQPRQTRDHRRRDEVLDDVEGDVAAEEEVCDDDRVVADFKVRKGDTK